MNANSSRGPHVTPDQVDEAAVWMTLLRAANRTRQTEAGFRRWLAANPAHPHAFERVSTAFEATSALSRGPFPHLSRWQRAGYRDGFARAILAIAAMLVLGIAAVFFWRNDGIATRVGEQRALSLEDGSQVYLNTDTRLLVRYAPQQRLVELQSGEAYFDVAQVPDRPFVVTAAGRHIIALGTSFVVRADPGQVSVTLVEGKIKVNQEVLVPGQRLTLTANSQPKIDTPVIEKVTAWRRGQLDFDDVPFEQAAAEMNRYSAQKLKCQPRDTDNASDPCQALKITGVFRTGAAHSLAIAIANEYHLQLHEHGSNIVLTTP